MEKKLSITVVISASNLEEYIEEAVKSVMLQTRKADEIIVVNDGSKDRTSEKIQKFKNHVKQIDLPVQSDVLTATLEGIRNANGDIISFLDGDDIWLLGKLEHIEREFINDPEVILITHDYSCMNSKGELIPYHADKTHENTRRIEDRAAGNPELKSQLLKNAILCYEGVWHGSAWSIRKSALDLDGFIQFTKSVPVKNYIQLTHQDQPLSAFLLLDQQNKDKRIGFVDAVLFKYRIHGKNTSGSIESAESAIRSVVLSFAMVTGTYLQVKKRPDLVEENKAQKMSLHHLYYLHALYTSKDLFSIFKNLFIALPRLSFQRCAYEFLRLVVVYILGINRFLKVKRYFTSHK